jgi:outer membrane protein assembly factor BamB
MRSSSRSRLGLVFVLLLVFATGLGLSTSLRGVAQANSPHIWLSKTVGPPTVSVQVHGNGFGVNETVLAYFDDTTQLGTATTDATGKFAAMITVPKSALPGTHTVRATGQSSGLTALARFLVQTDWAQFHFGLHHTGYNPYENVLTPSNVSALTPDWSYATGNNIYSIIYSSPAVAGGVVYIGSYDDTLYALDAVTGARKWSYTTGNWITSSPAVANGVVYVGSWDDTIYAFHLPGMS